MKLRSHEDVHKLSAYLRTVADWMEGFQRRADAAQRKLETIGLDPEEHDQLIEEGAALLLLIHRLGCKERRAA
jgi:hypothetical protein